LGSDGTLIEVSDGTIVLPRRERTRLIHMAREMGFEVITEVGKKVSGAALNPREAAAVIRADLAAGARKVVVEGRESGRGAGLYGPDGEIRTGDLEILLEQVSDPGVLMWEAPLKPQQEAWIRRFGPDVNLGNIPPGEVLALEALRRGLRSDTLRLALQGECDTIVVPEKPLL